MLKKNRIFWALILSLCFVLQALPTAVYAEEPGLVLEQVQLSDNTISKGDAFTASFVLRNNSTWGVKNVYIRVPSTDFSVKDKGSYFRAAKTLYAGDTVAITLDLECHDTVSNKIPLEITYDDYGGLSFVLEEQLLVTYGETEKEQYQPKLILAPQEVQSIGLGETKDISIIIKNTSEQEASKLLIRPVIANEYLSTISFNQVNMIPSDVSMLPGSEQVFEYKVTANGTATPGIYPISYELLYENTKKDSFTATLNGYLKITDDQSYCDVLVSGTVTSPKLPVRDGEMLLQVNLENEYEQEIQNLKVWIEGLPATGFVYQEDKLKKSPEIMKQRDMKVTYRYLISDQITEGYYPYEVHLTYTDINGNSIHNKESFGLYLGPQEERKGALTVTKVQLPSAPVIPEKAFKVSLEVCNTGVEVLEDINVAFTGTEILSKTINTVAIGSLAPGESKRAEYQLIASKQPEDKNLPVSFIITYDEKQGEGIELKTMNQSLGILVSKADEIDTQPKVLLNDLTLPEQIFLGEAFDLQFTLANTNESKAIHNMKVTMSSKDAATQSSNIILVGQSDSIYLAELPCKEEVLSKISLIIPTSYKNSVCDIDFTFTYEDDKGTVYNDKETIHIPVAEETALTASNVRVGNTREDGYTLELDFYNTGKGTLKNLMVDLEGEFEATNSNYYVGDLQSGRMDIYSVAVNGKVPELINGSILLTYEDNAGMKKELKVPFELHYTEPVEEPEVTEENTKKASFPYLPVILAGGLIFVVVAVIRKKRKAMV